MKTKLLPFVLLFAILPSLTARANSDAASSKLRSSVTPHFVKIVSPDSCQTFSNYAALDKKFMWNNGVFRASIDFSNVRYISRLDPRQDEWHTFRFPGVMYDRASKTFFARGSTGEQIPVAYNKGGIQPAPRTLVFILSSSGRVNLVLTAQSNGPTTELHWMEQSTRSYTD